MPYDDSGWRNFGRLGANRSAENVRGGQALGAAMESALSRLIREGGIRSPVTTNRGLNARLNYLNSVAGRQAMADAGITARPRTMDKWFAGTQQPMASNKEKIDTAYWNLRAERVLNNLGAFKQHLNNRGRGTSIEIHPVNQDLVDEKARRPNLLGEQAHRMLPNVRYIWDDAVDAMRQGDSDKLEEIWDDVIADMDSDWGAYTYVSYVGIGA
ncbi:hypothetical protein C9F11_42840 (plasmid) [Streptomyces sp. YIM 121038]|uniref:hypothetical protein n=1 Tax=Streptomyces sp. YIM 121038 TaxID=2136401 RepID=UPI001110D993|nr:hypothetical protein [Streptomyces sp. YIM 121038]QCX82148.1 hypothetical protein C9F11_42840 [Streptomyces sp. YIM 121038]